MNAFDQADALVQVCSGLLGIGVVVFFVYTTFFRKKKK
jgi:hypothetical protein